MTTPPTTPGTPLGKILKGGNGAQPPQPPTGSGSLLARFLAHGRRGEDVDLAVLGPVRIELVGAMATQDVNAAVYHAMKERGFDLSQLTMQDYEAERAIQTLALGVLDRATKQPFGTVDEWGKLDTYVVNAAWQAYGDVAERLDPAGAGDALTDDERIAIHSAIKKKHAALLRSFGVVKLSLFLSTTDVLPPTSPTPSSSSTPSPSES